MTVECADCGCSTRVLRRSAVMGAVTRVVECPCGSRFETVEKIARRLPSQVQLSTCSQQGLNTGLKQRLNPVQTREISVMGGLGGLISVPSDPDLSPVSGDLVSDTTVSLDQTRVGRGRPDAKRYPAEFEELWRGCEERRGNKEPAFKAWQRVKPPLRLTLERYALRRQTEQWQRGFIPHLSTWLNQRGWETPPEPREMGPQAPRKTRMELAQEAEAASWANR